MYCTRCGNEVQERDRFCCQCALPTGQHPVPEFGRELLTRDLQNKRIAGVCSGFARYLDVDPVLIRIIWLALAFGAGVGFIGYIIAWIIMPSGPVPVNTPARDFARYPG